ncbi:hypothetical protein CHLRE_04g217945v5 [Chlamydomonas reinhardtii]|uniref:Fatty acid desaturase domain-containing protein n=2 Tax=Chlamydomonas reinhardtii TaxID=3055 RepID=A0A2K3DTI8_CHLRE|nr:uncharacterized protein CHLRE_04g217945v5 [Chlamydomonas reinhardtii]XP_042925035.1 uncharacterized protein CHLRE_04g217945v5 [Chlamydomonas reinhardtii]XP_042925036.1 uncharacterized protein CHLRE_04g217945v5 [Chlamydomonas reinhardtii]PNW83842.1 hypothetical protein CHLRE_04g217945v5 [Chlamydomonas reinhardtii]PNW83843.1 hypothetical protein CHLRE_04g217945v5 [Chlamydomonas reinhardtii]PNW83844.1 hypothetical protein CHLRE_04g217945v5 [Chlamydomonas reinhardtii]
MQALRAQTSRSPQTYSNTCPILSRELTRCTTRRPGCVPTRATVVPCAQRQSQQGVEASRAVTSATPDAPEPVVERVSNSSGSRKAFAKAFTSLLGLQLAKPEDLDPDTLRNPPFPRYTPALSELSVQQLRPYFLNRTYTDTDVGYLAFFSAMHLVALVGGPLTYSPECLQLCLAGYVVTGMLGISMSYHRQLSHKSFRCVKPLEYLLAYCGALAFEGDPIEWSKMHRWHHLHSDTPADRHSPRDGLWHSHMGWLFDEALNSTRRDAQGNMKDSLSPPWFYKESPAFYGWLRDTYMYHQIGQGVFFYLWGGVPYLIWGFVIRVLFTMHMTWLVNSAVHIWGEQRYQSDDSSRNNWLVGLLVFGDGHHNNHHAFEYSAAHGLEWWEVDMSYYMIRILELTGLAWDVKRPSATAMAAKRLPGK